MSALGGKVAIVTGASSGIGFATAQLFAAEGACVVVGARREDHLKRLVDRISASGGRAIALAGDVQDEDYARALVNTAVQEFGGLDIALNNAATMGVLGAISQMSRQNWTTTIETNLTGAFLGAKYQIPAMQARGGGSLIFTSTFVGHTVGFPGTVAYAASKAGLIGMTQVLAAEFGPVGIRVNALLPGGTDTDMAREMNNSEEAKAFVRSLHALKRLARPEEIARSALFLASDASSFTTGIALLADGGVSITRTSSPKRKPPLRLRGSAAAAKGAMLTLRVGDPRQPARGSPI